MSSDTLSSSVNQFSAKFLKELHKTKSVVSSPLSAEFVLALIALGSEEPAHQELLSTLGLSDNEEIRATFSQAFAKIKSIKGVTLNVANKIYIKEGPYELHKDLINDAVNIFDTAMEKINFVDAVKAANSINEWVESKTDKKIKNLITSDSLSEDTRLVLINALYFKGVWKTRFDPSYTLGQPFHVSSSKVVQVPMMFVEDKFKYGESHELQSQLLEMPYVGEQTSMLIVLPKDLDTGLDRVINMLASGFDLMGEVKNMSMIKVRVSLPRFKVETEIDLKQLLPKLGINAIFNPANSGLTKILDNKEPLYVSKAIQKAFIEVNEQGAEAAAATGLGIRQRRSLLPTKEFNVNRPALCCIILHETVIFTAIYRHDDPVLHDEL